MSKGVTMTRIDSTIDNYVDVVQEMIESGETLLFERADGKKYVVCRECTNNKYATIQDCEDGEIDSFHIFDNLEELLQDVICYKNISLTICVA